VSQRPTNDPTNGRRVLDVAEGILIALRHCSAEQAFDELVTTSTRRNVPLFALAQALINLAAGRCETEPDHAARAVRSQWADAFDGRSEVKELAPPESHPSSVNAVTTLRSFSHHSVDGARGEVLDGRPLATPNGNEIFREIAQLRLKLTSQPVIEQAKGMLMQSFGLKADDAFNVLKSLSQDCNVKLRDVSRRIVDDCTSDAPRPEYHTAEDYLHFVRRDLRSSVV
jgi:hypothetical protein